MSSAVEKVMALSTAEFTGKLPHPLDGTPQVKHPKVRVRSLVSNRFGPDGQVVQAGQVLELPSPEAAGWIALHWAEAA
jgi:hypothetical protein